MWWILQRDKMKTFLTTVEYEFRLSGPGNFSFCLQQCKDLGGNLIVDNLEPQGKKYHELVFKR